MRRTILPLIQRPPLRPLSTSTRLSSSPFTRGPAPPRLPKEEQEVFERLQKASTGAFSTPRSLDPSPSTPTSTNNTANTSTSRPQINQSPDSMPATTVRISEGDDLHPNLRRGAPPEFEGDVNPKTGEVGGPKNEPLRWGAGADWSYNGRVTDF